MTGGQANLRTAAIALGLALLVVGLFSVIRGATAPTVVEKNRSPELRFAALDRYASTETAAITLGPLETDDSPPVMRSARKLSTAPAQLAAEIDPAEIPPAPEKPMDGDGVAVPPAKVAPPVRSPAAELLDLEPLPSMSTPEAPPPSVPTVNGADERQTQQLARIARGIERLSQQITQTLVERPVAALPPSRPETFTTPVEPRDTAVIKLERTAEDRDRFSLEVHAATVSDVFTVLCDLAGLKLELAPEVTERVTLTLRDVTLGEAINAVLRHADLGVERDENLLRVMPRTMAEERALRRQPQFTRTYRPRVKNVAALLPLIRPLLTPQLGRVTVMPGPPSETLVVADREEVHTEVAKLLQELDGRMGTP